MPLAVTYQGYASMLWTKHSSLATWQPDRPLAVGDVVTCGAGGVITRETSVTDLGVTAGRLTILTSAASPVREHYGVAISAGASGSIAATGSAKAKFSSSASFLIVTNEGRLDSVSNMAEARALVEELNAARTWGKGWHLVTSVRAYPACTIIIANEKGTEAAVIVDGSAAGLAPGAVQAGAQVSVNSTHVSYWVMPSESTPMFQAVGMRRKILGSRAVDSSHRYLTRDQQPGASVPGGGLGDESGEFVAQMSSPTDLGLL